MLVWVVAVVALAGALALAGLRYVAPGVIRSQLQQLGAAATGRSVQVGAVRIDPLQPALEVDGLRVMDAQGSAVFASFDRLRVTLSWTSLRALAPVIASVQLDGPAVHLVRHKDGGLSTDDIGAALVRWRASSPPAKTDGSLPRFALYNLSLAGGSVILDDELGPVHHDVQHIELDVPLFSTLAAREQIRVDPRFSAVVDGAAVSLRGQSHPFASVPTATIDIDLKDVDLSRYGAWIPGLAAMSPAGSASLNLTLETAVPAEARASLSAQGVVSIRGLRFAPMAGHAPVRLEDVSLQVRRFSYPSGPVDASLGFQGKPVIALLGDADWATLGIDAGVKVHSFDLPPWLAPFDADLAWRLTRGALTADTRVKHKPDDPSWQLAGDVFLEKVATLDRASAKDLIAVDRLAVHGLQLSTHPLAVRVDQINLDGSSARVSLDPDGQLNLLKAFGQGKAGAATSPASAGSDGATAGSPPQRAEAPSPLHIGRVFVRDAKVQFTDAFVKPAYRADITRLHGSILGLDGGPGGTAQLQWEGSVNEAPLLIDGSFDAGEPASRLHVHASVHGMEMTDLSPYSGKYAGYRIERGKLSFDADYRIEQRELVAQNRLVLDQLAFGDRVESPDATSLPVSLAIALLKDRNGVIDIELPVGGSIDQPEFSIGGLVWRSLINLIGKAVTSPFAWLGSLAEGGGGGEISELPFDAGNTALTDAARQRLAAVVKAMTQRPQIKLDISGAVDGQIDTSSLKTAKVEKLLRSLKRRNLLQAGAPVPETALTIEPAERLALLEQALAQLAPTGAAPTATVSAAAGHSDAATTSSAQAAATSAEDRTSVLQKDLEAKIDITQDDLIDLGNRRAKVVKMWMTDQGGVDDARLAVVVAHVREPADTGVAFSGVRLDVHD